MKCEKCKEPLTRIKGSNNWISKIDATIYCTGTTRKHTPFHEPAAPVAANQEIELGCAHGCTNSQVAKQCPIHVVERITKLVADNGPRVDTSLFPPMNPPRLSELSNLPPEQITAPSGFIRPASLSLPITVDPNWCEVHQVIMSSCEADRRKGCRMGTRPEMPLALDRVTLAEHFAHEYAYNLHPDEAALTALFLKYYNECTSRFTVAVSVQQESLSAEHKLMWSEETMQIINRLTPDIKGKAFDIEWFLLRQRFEEFEYKANHSVAAIAAHLPPMSASLKTYHYATCPTQNCDCSDCRDCCDGKPCIIANTHIESAHLQRAQKAEAELLALKSQPAAPRTQGREQIGSIAHELAEIALRNHRPPNESLFDYQSRIEAMFEAALLTQARTQLSPKCPKCGSGEHIRFFAQGSVPRIACIKNNCTSTSKVLVTAEDLSAFFTALPEAPSLNKLAEAVRSLLEIGKRDLTNPKYDGYFEALREGLKEERERKG